MNHQPKNKFIYTDHGRAEVFFQTINLDHYLTRYLIDLNKPADKRFYRLTFSEITKVLSQGNVPVTLQILIENATQHHQRSPPVNRYN